MMIDECFQERTHDRLRKYFIFSPLVSNNFLAEYGADVDL